MPARPRLPGLLVPIFAVSASALMEPLLEARKCALGKVPPNHSLLACRNDRRMQQGGNWGTIMGGTGIAAQLDVPLSAHSKTVTEPPSHCNNSECTCRVSSAWNEVITATLARVARRGRGFRDPGVGPITASLIATKIAHIGLFKSARYLAASAFDVSSDWNPPSRTSA
jgi:hypothetical protein